MGASNSADFEGEKVTIGSKTATISDEIDSGTEGIVYKITEFDDSVIKVFYKDRRNRKAEKIQAMIPNNPNHDAIIWPEKIVWDYDTGKFIGYMMPFKDLNPAKNALHYTLTELKWEQSEKQHRHRVASNLATMVREIHEEGHAIGDFNHDNILIDPNGQVTLIDCDGYHITDGDDLYQDDTYYPRYSPPEGRGENTLSDVQAADRFCLGVHIFQFLMNGYHPYLAQGDEAKDGDMEDKIAHNKFPYVYSNYQPIDEAPSVEEYEEEVPKYLRILFKQCFTQAGKDASISDVIGETKSSRPKIPEWIRPYEQKDNSAGSSWDTAQEDDDQHSNTELENKGSSTGSNVDENSIFSNWDKEASGDEDGVSKDPFGDWDEF
jgi:DNA-binding helix-hairpin-helix protein with protein kinase domain